MTGQIKKLRLLLGVLIFTFILLLCFGWVAMQPPKIAFVRSQELIFDYVGMKEVQNKLTFQRQLWQANLDSLQLDFDLNLQTYRNEYPKLTKEERKAREEALGVLENNFRRYSEVIGGKSRELEEQLTAGVLNQVNSFAEKYGKEKGYDVILGTTLSGSILYGDDRMDITKELLELLNANYTGEDAVN